MTLDMSSFLFQSAECVLLLLLLLWGLLLQHLSECETASHHDNAQETAGVIDWVLG